MKKQQLPETDCFVQIKTVNGELLSAWYYQKSITGKFGKREKAPAFRVTQYCEFELEDIISWRPLKIYWEFESWSEKAESLAAIVGYDDFGYKYTGGGLIVLDAVEEVHELDIERTFSRMPDLDAVSLPLLRSFRNTKIDGDLSKKLFGDILEAEFNKPGLPFERACDIVSLAKWLQAPNFLDLFERCEPENFPGADSIKGGTPQPPKIPLSVAASEIKAGNAQLHMDVNDHDLMNKLFAIAFSDIVRIPKAETFKGGYFSHKGYGFHDSDIENKSLLTFKLSEIKKPE